MLFYIVLWQHFFRFVNSLQKKTTTAPLIHRYNWLICQYRFVFGTIRNFFLKLTNQRICSWFWPSSIRMRELEKTASKIFFYFHWSYPVLNKYMLFTEWEGRTGKIFSRGLRSGPRPKVEGRFWVRRKIFFSTALPSGK
jgi:hypothetical protein